MLMMSDGKIDGRDGKSKKFYRQLQICNDKTLSSRDGHDGDFFNFKKKKEIKSTLVISKKRPSRPLEQINSSTYKESSASSLCEERAF